jgi:putative endonuclease
MMRKKRSAWAVYLLKCADGTLYCGVTTDVTRRVREHNTAKIGAKYTRARRPVKLVHTERFATRATAQAREYAIKQLPRASKNALLKTARAR